MRLGPLEKVRHKIVQGKPLPCGIRDAAGRLLLARGNVLANDEQVQALLDRGAFVDLDELMGPRAEILQAPPERLPGLWRAHAERVAAQLQAPPTAGWPERLLETARTGLTLVDRLPDLAIYMVVRGDAPPNLHYGVMHSVHTATTLALMGRRLGWDDPQIVRLMAAALTMNLSVLPLQGRLAVQHDKPTALQRTALNEHPARSAALLTVAGVTDAGWLTAVAQHHEVRGGTGYPARLAEPDDGADALRVADVYTAKLSPRATRAALATPVAAKQVFTAEAGRPHGAAVIKEFGLYPPGAFVALQSGELGVAVRRGETASTPVVAALVGRSGDPLMQPVLRDTAHKAHAVAQTVPESRVPVRLGPERLFADRL